MAIYGTEQKEIFGAKTVAMATSKFASSCVFLDAQYWCQVSIIFIHSLLRYTSFCNKCKEDPRSY